MVREVGDSKNKVVGAVKAWGQMSRNEKMERLVRKGRKAVWKTAALRNLALFMHCTVGLSGEEPLLDRVRAPGTNWEALNYPPQHREAMR